MSKLKVAWERRSRLLSEKTQCFRWIDGAIDGFPHLTIDVFDQALWVESEQENPILPLGDLEKNFDIIFLKTRLKEGKAQIQSLGRNSNPKPFIVTEGSMKFLIDFEAGTHPGLFIDQRKNRERVFANSSGRKILNLFCYTGSFSVAAIKGNASEVVSVDLSQPYLDWNKQNIALNDGDSSKHKIIREDCLQYLKRLERRQEKFDGIILDPPSFSRNHKGKVMSLEKDLEGLAIACGKILKKDGWFFASANLRKISSKDFEQALSRGLPQRPKSYEKLLMPEDFPGSSYLHAAWIQM